MHPMIRTTGALLLAGFAIAPGASAQSLPCGQGNNHCITVTVGSGGDARISVDRPRLYVQGANHVIFWQIKNTGSQSYRFAPNGVAFKTPAGQHEFSCGPRDATGRVYFCLDPNGSKGTFEYGITLTGAPAVPPLDPWVINQ
jgi:hypothetical protein